MKTFFELFPKAKIPVTNQGALTIDVTVRSKETHEVIRRESIKRALLAKMLNEHKILGLDGEFIIEV
jgi:hypothetical protein